MVKIDKYNFLELGKDFRINDGISRAASLPAYIKELTDTAEVQRLENIIQNGFSYYAFPNLKHSRKVHSISTAKYAFEMLKSAVSNGPIKLSSTYEAEILCGALLHDIGHSPFSHDLELIIRHFTEKSHEEVASELILGKYSLREFYNEVPKEIIPLNQKRAISNILKNVPSIPDILKHYGICGDLVSKLFNHENKSNHENKTDPIEGLHFLTEIIDNKVIDADKIEYLVRDPKNAGLSETQFNPKGIISELGIVRTDNGFHIATTDMGIEMINQLLLTREYAYSRVYTHKTVLKIQAMVYEAIKMLFKSLEKEKAKELGGKLYLLDDNQFQSFIISPLNKNRDSVELYMKARYDRRNKYVFAYQIESKDLPNYNDNFTNKSLEMLKRLNEIKNFKGDTFEFGEDRIKSEILDIVNSTNRTELKEHEIIVYFPFQKEIKSRDERINDFNLYVFDHRNPEKFYLASEALKDKNFFDERLEAAFYTFCRHQTSNYFLVLCPKEHYEKVNKATEEYIKKIMI